MSEGLLQAVMTIVGGALAGGLTNTVAIWMIFHPYEPPRIFGWTLGFLQGAVPKNQPRLAAAIGRTVGNRLLTPEDLTKIFQQPEFRAAFDERLADFLRSLLLVERGSLRDILPQAVIPQVEGLLSDLLEHALGQLDEYVHSERFEGAVEARTDDLLGAVREEPIGGLLTPAREEAIREALEEWLTGVAESEDLRTAVEEYIERASHRLLQPGRTFEEILPQGLVGSFEQAIQSYLPLAIERLGGLLEDPDTRARFESTLNDLFHRFLSDLKFHQRVVARLVVTEDTLDRVLDTIEKEGAERLSELLQEQTVQEAMARGVNDAIVDFLRRPVESVLGGPDSENVVEARTTLVDWMIRVAGDANTRAFLVERLDQVFEQASARTWGDVLDRLPTEKIQRGLVEVARSEATARIARESGTKAVSGLLDRRIGTPSEWMPENAPRRIEETFGDPLWEWLQTQVPDVVERLDVARRVEEKVLEFPTPKMEEIVRKVTDRELRLIVRLGYVLGAFVGIILLVMNRLMGW